MNFDLSVLEGHLPRTLTWLRHMITLPRLLEAASRCSFHLPRMRRALLPTTTEKQGEGAASTCDAEGEGDDKNSPAGVSFLKPPMEDVTEDDMELRLVLG